MEILFINATHRNGISHKSGSPRPYDICTVTYGVPVEPVVKEEMKYRGFGVEPKEIECLPQVIDQLGKAKVGDMVALDIGFNPRNLNRTVVNGVLAINGEAVSHGKS